jgi:hypothetical protein
MRCRTRASTIVAVALLALVVGACVGGDDGDGDDKARPSPPPASETPFGDGGGTPPASPAQLPPAFVKCMAGQGFDVQSPADIHSAPPQVLQTCFGALHQGGG